MENFIYDDLEKSSSDDSYNEDDSDNDESNEQFVKSQKIVLATTKS